MKNLNLVLLLIATFALSTFAHRMLLMIEDNGDGTLYIEAGLSTGNVPAGARIILKEKSTGRPFWQGKVPNDGKLTIDQPTTPYTVTLNAGAGHAVTKEGPLREVTADTPTKAPQEADEETTETTTVEVSDSLRSMDTTTENSSQKK